MIKINLKKAKDIAHEKRRAARAEEFAPLDIKATIPSEAAQAEAARQAIREKYAALQSKIDGAKTPEELKALLYESTNSNN
jgi:predicted  nucleic acid-binding Zn-ribbon protein